MRWIFRQIILFLCLGLIGCSTTTRNENVILGTLTGAVVGGASGNALCKGNRRGADIGIGAVIGALIGAGIGYYIDSKDHSSNYPILTRQPFDASKTWLDPQTNVVYALTPTGNLYTVNGNPNCRHFHFKSTRYDYKNEYEGAACLKSDGNWQRV